MMIIIIIIIIIMDGDGDNDTGNEGNVLFNDTLNTFYLRLYGVGKMIMMHAIYYHCQSKHGY